MISALQSATPVLDIVGAAGIVAGTVSYTKFIFGRIREPLRTNIVRLYVFAVSLLYVYAWNWLYGTLETGPQIVTAYSVALAVAGGALAGYHLLRGDFNGANPPPATDTAPDEPVSTAPSLHVQRDADGRDPELVPEWDIPPIVPAEPIAAVPAARTSQEQETTIDPPVHWAGDKPVSELSKEDGS